jgi:acetoin utilization deacetylase AcuC-like enzyme
MNPDRREAVREAGERYGTMAADLSLVHISMASSEEAVRDHINDLVRNIREQAAQQAREDLAAVWKEAALKAAQARLEASGGPEEANPSGD